MTIWSLLFGGITVIAIVASIIDQELHLAAIIACGFMASIGLMILGPLIIHRKKIIIKRDIIITNQMQKRIKCALLPLWNNPNARLALPRGIWFSRGKIIRLSWIKKRQHIDLSKIIEFRERSAVFTINFMPGRSWDNVRDILVDLVIIRDVDGILYLVDLTEFSKRNYIEIIEFLKGIVRENAALFKEAKPVIIPNEISRKINHNPAPLEGYALELKKAKRKEIEKEISASKEAGLKSLLITEINVHPAIIIELIKEINGKSTEEIAEMISDLPCLVISGIERREALILADRFTSVGIKSRVEIR